MRIKNRDKKLVIERLSSAQLIVLIYFIAVTISTALISLPIAHKEGVNLSFIDALFTAASAVSVTGLTVISIADTFSVTGVFIIIIILQFGGIGIMAMGTFLWIILGKKIGLKERKLIMTDYNRTRLSGLVKLMKQILLLIMTIELIGAIVLGIYFLNYFPTWQEAFLQGLFASVSATTNVGFDITGESLKPFAHDYFVQMINMVLIILGAIGFPVLIEIKEFFSHRKKISYRFSLFTKLTVSTYFILLVVGAIFIFLIERTRFFVDKAWHETLFYALFNSVTARSAGLATMDINDFSIPTLLILSVLMFIGASPNSVGGGIRTTTFAIAMLSLISYAKGKSSIKVFHRQIETDDIFRSFIVIMTALMLCGGAICLLAYLENFTLIQIVVEVCSAFGTTGLTMGITPDLSLGGKLIIIFLMFIGRIGIFSFLFMIRGNAKEDNYQYPKEHVIIGQ